MKERLKNYIQFVLPTLENGKNEKGYLWVNNPNTNFSRQYYFDTYEQGAVLIDKFKHNSCYIGLSTTDGKDYKTDNLINRNVIVVDIDTEGLEISDIYAKCKEVGLFVHMVVNSGRGWHLYFKLDDNYKIFDIVKVNKKITQLFKADENACKTTQIIRVPYTKNFKVNSFASIVGSNQPTKLYSLSKLENHKIQHINTGDTDLQFDDIDDLYCFNQLVKYGASEGMRNQSVMFIANTCKYAKLSYTQALDYASIFNDNCIKPQRANEIRKTVRSIYDNPSIIKPCKMECGKKLCSISCKAKVIQSDDILNKVDDNADKDIQIGFTNKLFNQNVKITRKQDKVERGTMLSILNGGEILILSELKTFRNNIHTVESLVECTKLSKPTVSKSLKTLTELNLINSTKQSINKSAKPTTLYTFNDDSVKRYSDIVAIGRALFICRINKLITDSDMKIYLALKYLYETNQPMTQLDIERVSGVARTKINTSLTNLQKRDIIRVDKIRTSTGYCNSYTLKM